ncbi:transglutaminase-like domain-containing protein [Rhizorhabdus dicambivorans]|uniref:Transglutaminase family protein n=1 Tax=Rhizorhabdus dicambivorans TaxID=1850238 RepID=A0A2A4FXU6_9SPHN|nr:transglutaminase family protein [Rhizorhabdus dicambivorans]ATE67408.1 transglutaminase family protein [Rhizorhabdus dicambivorans]PCE43025.1 transglutaminase family protein [Rhizorhabdus dicambivorans]
MRLTIETDLRYHFAEPADVLLTVEVAQLPDQALIGDRLVIDGVGPLRAIDGEDGIGRRTWMRAEGDFQARYSAEVELDRRPVTIDELPITPRRELPASVIPYLWPSRYCEADRFEAFVEREFPGANHGARVLAMAKWIREHLDYCPGASDARTTAVDVFVSRQGVCRDFAHLLASFARAAGVPARLVSAYAWDLDPPDFHAVVEVWLAGDWYLVDPTELAPHDGLVRIAVGRDATDIAFMTIFGTAELIEQSVSVRRQDTALPG